MRRRDWAGTAVLALAGALVAGIALDHGVGVSGRTAVIRPRPTPAVVATPAPSRPPRLSATSSPPAGRRVPGLAPYPRATGTTTPARPPARTAVPVKVPVNIDGCDHSYGARVQCVPWSFPPGVEDRCQWLRSHGYGPLVVLGPDRLQLDANHNGIACDATER